MNFLLVYSNVSSSTLAMCRTPLTFRKFIYNMLVISKHCWTVSTLVMDFLLRIRQPSRRCAEASKDGKSSSYSPLKDFRYRLLGLGNFYFAISTVSENQRMWLICGSGDAIDAQILPTATPGVRLLISKHQFPPTLSLLILSNKPPPIPRTT